MYQDHWRDLLKMQITQASPIYEDKVRLTAPLGMHKGGLYTTGRNATTWHWRVSNSSTLASKLELPDYTWYPEMPHHTIHWNLVVREWQDHKAGSRTSQGGAGHQLHH